jgi:hypothetical protein
MHLAVLLALLLQLEEVTELPGYQRSPTTLLSYFDMILKLCTDFCQRLSAVLGP